MTALLVYTQRSFINIIKLLRIAFKKEVLMFKNKISLWDCIIDVDRNISTLDTHYGRFYEKHLDSGNRFCGGFGEGEGSGYCSADGCDFNLGVRECYFREDLFSWDAE